MDTLQVKEAIVMETYRNSGVALCALVAAGAALLSGTVLAQQPPPYVGIVGGAEFLRNADNTGSGVTLTSKTKTGYSVGIVVGEKLDSNWRFEGEFDYRRANLDKLTLTDASGLTLPPLTSENLSQYYGSSVAGSGHVRVLDLMANAWYDFPLGGGWKPYVGGGLGVANVKLVDVGVAGYPAFVNDSGNFLAYQLGVGIGYAVTPSTTVSLDYRYFGTATPTFTAVDGTSFDSEARGNNVGLSLRYWF